MDAAFILCYDNRMKQIDIYKKMTGEERLLQTVKLSAMVREIALSSIKNDFPHLSQRKLIQKYLERLSAGAYGRIRNFTNANRFV